MMLSRVADSLYWMSRYIERAEHTARVIAVKLESMIEQTPEDAARLLGAGGRGADRRMSLERPAAGRLRHHPKGWPSTAIMNASLITSLTLARDNARQVREALSNEVWENLNRLYLRLSPVTMEFHLGAYAGARCSARRWKKCMRWKA